MEAKGLAFFIISFTLSLFLIVCVIDLFVLDSIWLHVASM